MVASPSIPVVVAPMWCPRETVSSDHAFSARLLVSPSLLSSLVESAMLGKYLPEVGACGVLKGCSLHNLSEPLYFMSSAGQSQASYPLSWSNSTSNPRQRKNSPRKPSRSTSESELIQPFYASFLSGSVTPLPPDVEGEQHLPAIDSVRRRQGGTKKSHRRRPGSRGTRNVRLELFVICRFAYDVLQSSERSQRGPESSEIP